MQFVEDKRGFSTHHLGLVYTLFSASNYCGTAGNKAVGFWICWLPKDLPISSYEEIKLKLKLYTVYLYSHIYIYELSVVRSFEDRFLVALCADGIDWHCTSNIFCNSG